MSWWSLVASPSKTKTLLIPHFFCFLDIYSESFLEVSEHGLQPRRLEDCRGDEVFSKDDHWQMIQKSGAPGNWERKKSLMAIVEENEVVLNIIT